MITSPKNHQRLEKIRSDHLRLADPEVTDEVRVESLPAVIWMGYGVHGNEPSAANAAPLVAYHLAAGQSEWVKQVLDNTVILLDPCLNPDGFERFAHWANNHRGQIANGDPNHREHREGSPTGRSNYYWFDLNRDWLPVQHPESQGRLSIYHQWLPNVVLDFHEMGGDATYFFQPGVPTQMHPLTPEKNLEFTRKFAAEHAKSLNDIGALYFTEEKFDDFYMGKGSTYPDLHGAVGILFEQASARGQQQDFPNGRLEFPFAIRNQVRTSLTSLNATVAERVSLHEYKRDFYRQALEQANASPTKGFVFSAGADRSRAREFLRILSMHKIQVCTLVEDVELEGHKYLANESFFIPADQPEFPFLMAMTERRTEFKDPCSTTFRRGRCRLRLALHGHRSTKLCRNKSWVSRSNSCLTRVATSLSRTTITLISLTGTTKQRRIR